MTIEVKLHPKMAKCKPSTIEQHSNRAIDGFEHGDSGYSNHSPQAMTLPFVINYLEDHKQGYVLWAFPDDGYSIERIKGMGFRDLDAAMKAYMNEAWPGWEKAQGDKAIVFRQIKNAFRYGWRARREFDARAKVQKGQSKRGR